jgi:hypothetical protein
MGRDTGKPPGGPYGAAGGPTPAGRTRRSRRAEQGRMQGPARPCAPQSARPDQLNTQRPSGESTPAETRVVGSVADPDMHGRDQAGPKAKDAPPETLGQKGALALAKRLEQYWHGKGFPAARFWVEPIGERFEKVGTYELYRVVSNLVNGLPPRYQDQGAAPVKKG